MKFYSMDEAGEKERAADEDEQPSVASSGYDLSRSCKTVQNIIEDELCGACWDGRVCMCSQLECSEPDISNVLAAINLVAAKRSGMSLYCFVATGLIAAGIALAAEAPSVDRGSELFNQIFGGNGRSCNSCHPNGKGLKKIKSYNDAQLELIINQCIFERLDRSNLPLNSPSLSSLIAYVRMIQSSAKPTPQK